MCTWKTCPRFPGRCISKIPDITESSASTNPTMKHTRNTFGQLIANNASSIFSAPVFAFVAPDIVRHLPSLPACQRRTQHAHVANHQRRQCACGGNYQEQLGPVRREHFICSHSNSAATCRAPCRGGVHSSADPPVPAFPNSLPAAPGLYANRYAG